MCRCMSNSSFFVTYRETENTALLALVTVRLSMDYMQCDYLDNTNMGK